MGVGLQNPFEFQHITQLNGPQELDDTGSCVVLATPSMLQVHPRPSFATRVCPRLPS